MHGPILLLLSSNEVSRYKRSVLVVLEFNVTSKVVFQILGRKFYKNTKRSSVYSQSLLDIIHKTPVVKSHPTTSEMRDLLRPRSTPTGNTVYFYMSSLLIYILKIHRRSFKHNLSVIL